MSRQQRLLAMLVTLQARRRTTAAELAAELGVSSRTVLRDVAALADAEVPVVADRGRYGGIMRLPGTQLDLGRLTGTEMDLLQVFGLDVARARQLGLDVAARTAATKLASRRRTLAASGSRAAQRLRLADVVTVDSRSWFASDDETDVAALASDLHLGRRLGISYRRSGQQRSRPKTVDPYGVLLRSGRWYLVAEAEGVPRLYALSRLETWTVIDEPRRLRAGATLAEVARELGDALEAPGTITISAKIATSRLDLARRILGARLTSVALHEHCDTTPITVSYDELDGGRQLLQFGDHIEVIDPPEARRLIQRLARALADRHSD